MIDINELILAALVAGCFFAIPIIAAFMYLENVAYSKRIAAYKRAVAKFKEGAE